MRNHCLTAAVVVAAFHHRRVLPLMARRRRLFDMRPDEPIEGIRMSAAALSEEAVLHRVRETVDRKMKSGGLTHIVVRPSRGYLSLVSHASLQPRGLPIPHHFMFPYPCSPFPQGMRDVRASPPPIPEDARQQAINRAHIEAQKKWKDAKAAKRTKQILVREKLDERRRQQRKDGLPESSSLVLVN